jgi:hypothetical protein
MMARLDFGFDPNNGHQRSSARCPPLAEVVGIIQSPDPRMTDGPR